MNTTQKRITDLIARGEALHNARGTSVRCPVCNAAAGKFCRDGQRNTITHAERVSLAAK